MEPTNSNHIDGRYHSSVDRNLDQTVNRNIHTSVERDSWTSMAQNLYTDLNTLWQKESLLIRTELNEKVNDIKVAAGSLVTGASFLLVGLFAAVATAIIALDYVMPLWASALIVTATVLIIGGVLLAGAKKKLEAERLKPTRSIETLDEIRHTFQERINEFKHH